LVFCGYTKNTTLTFILLVLSKSFSGLMYAGFKPIYLECCPKYSGFMYSLSNTYGNIPGIIAPYITGVIIGNTKDKTSDSGW